jgi:hypothetical protein
MLADKLSIDLELVPWLRNVFQISNNYISPQQVVISEQLAVVQKSTGIERLKIDKCCGKLHFV